MTSDLIQQIAATAIAEVGATPGKVLLYLEVEDGVISADLFHLPQLASPVKFRFASDRLRDLAHGYWQAGGANVAPRSWACAALTIENGSFTLDLIYPNQLAAGEDLSDRRPRVVAAQFPGMCVDYSGASG